MPKPQHHSGYSDRTTEAVRRVLLDLAHLLGPYRDRIVIVGGLAPSLLITDAEEPHVGTMDIDLALDASGLQDGDAYAHMIELLEHHGFYRNTTDPELRGFQLATRVDLKDGGPAVVVEVDLLIPKNVKLKKHRPPLTAGLRTQQMPGIDLALQHVVDTPLRGRNRKGQQDPPPSGSPPPKRSWCSKALPC
ncbi:hypothetical protein [Deinococcus roseus]|uniref:Nucleotidyl transferase AbiEii/AbiGii toxin family protein n=1 Tax=Deinococcus roseus TaxID=392414 RepID=A0ABQ2DFI7_9DEIO|nr:hypothetical protein [Deinococcus roseus]GGJ55888.1 hypothetical protein GCM10008938_47570 [Deinococcus roseus]